MNNYIIVAADGHWKTKGAYVKKLGNLDYDLAIVNKAVIDYLVHGIPVEKTINECNSLKEFQMIKKISAKYQAIYHGDDKLNEKCVRCFASTRYEDMSLTKLHQNGKSSKIEGTPKHCHLVNGSVNGEEIPTWLDRKWYIKTAQERIDDFIGGMDAFDF